jgi:hypothetical protein
MKKNVSIIIPLFAAVLMSACGPEDGGEFDEVAFDEAAIEGKSYSSVALRTDNGHYVVAENGGGTKVNANRVAIGEWEKFRMYELGGDLVALRASSGQWVVAEYGGGWRVFANRSNVGAWETFRRIHSWDGRIALQTHTGHFLVAEGGGGGIFAADRTAIGPWELFTVIR